MTEGERIIRLETQMQNIEDKVDEVKTLLEDFIKNSTDQFASKWVERAIYGAAAIVGGVLIYAGMSYLLRTPVIVP